MNTFIFTSVMFTLLISLILLWFICRQDDHWVIKIIVSLLVLFGSYRMYNDWTSTQGYPKGITEDQLDGTIISYFVKEPRKDDKGGIYVWMVPANEKIVRNIVVPYQKSEHQKLEKKQELKDKKTVDVRIQMKDGKPIFHFESDGEPLDLKRVTLPSKN